MCRDVHVLKLVERWEISAQRGERLSAEQLCCDYPELIETMREQIARLRGMDAAPVAKDPTSDTATAAVGVATQSQDAGVTDSTWYPLAPGEDREEIPRHQPVIGHFRTLERLGSGGFGTVWKAYDPSLDRMVAIKVPNAQHMSKEDVARFLREGKAAAQLKHPNIICVYDVASYDDVPYIVTEFVNGVSLDKWIKHHRPAPRAAAQVCYTLADAMLHAHNLGVVHRDLKPSNVVMGANDQPYIMDFGLAKRDADDVTMTADGAILGTPAYMAPEQARGEGHRADARTDVYSLGVVLFELLTGERPFRGQVTMLLRQVLEDEPPRPRQLSNSIPRDLETICLKCLEKDPLRRYQTAGELADDLQNFLAGREIKARPVGKLGRIWRWYRADSTAAVATAGGYSILSGCILLCWGLIGTAYYSLGFEPTEDRGRAVLELLAMCLLVYPLFISAGVATLNGRMLILWLSAVWWLVWSVAAIGTMFGILPTLLEWAVMSSARSDVFVRLQLFSLISVLCLFGVATHASALVLYYTRPISGRNATERGGI